VHHFKQVDIDSKVLMTFYH